MTTITATALRNLDAAFAGLDTFGTAAEYDATLAVLRTAALDCGMPSDTADVHDWAANALVQHTDDVARLHGFADRAAYDAQYDAIESGRYEVSFWKSDWTGSGDVAGDFADTASAEAMAASKRALGYGAVVKPIHVYRGSGERVS